MSSLISAVERLSEAKRTVLEKYLRGDLAHAGEDAGVINPRPSAELAPLSLAQEQLWLRDQTAGIPPLHNESITLHRRGPLDVAVLEECLTEIIRRHEIWRTTDAPTNSRPYQAIHPEPSTFPSLVLHLRALPDANRHREPPL